MTFALMVTPVFAEPITVLALGDSLTQGYGLPEADGLVPQLERWIEAQGTEVEIINGGVSGDTTAGGAARIAWSLTEDVDAVIVALGGNDLLRGIDVASVRANLTQIMEEITARDLPALVVGYKATPNYGPDYKTAFDAIYPALAAEYGAVFFPYVFRGMAQAVEAGDVTTAQLMQNDGIHPNAQGVALNVAAMGPYVLELIEVAKAP